MAPFSKATEKSYIISFLFSRYFYCKKQDYLIEYIGLRGRSCFFRGMVMNKDRQRRLEVLPLIFAFAVIPLILGVKAYNTELSQYSWYAGYNPERVDIFLYWKNVFVVLTGILMALILLFRYYINREKLLNGLMKGRRLIIFLLLVILVFETISAFSASPLTLSFRGSMEEFQSFPAQLSYIVFFIYAFEMLSDKEHIITFFRGASPFLAVLLTVGALQRIGYDVFNTDLGKFWMSPFNSGYNFSLNYKGPYMTFYNIDNNAMYFALLVPFLIAMVFLLRSWIEKIWVFFLLFESCIVISWRDPLSLKIALAAAGGAFLLFLLFKGILRVGNKEGTKLLSRRIICYVLFFAVVAGGLVFSARYVLSDRSDYPFDAAETGTDSVRLYMSAKEGAYIDIERGDASDGAYKGYLLKDNEGDRIEFGKKGKFVLKGLGEGGSDLSGTLSPGDGTVEIKLSGIRPITFADKEKQGFFWVKPTTQKQVRLNGEDAPYVKVFGRKFMTGRGGYYNATIGILKDHIFRGTGSSAFVTALNQDNFRFMESRAPILTKPHNMYMQLWVEESFVTLIAFLVLVIYLLWKAVKTFAYLPLKEHPVGIALIFSIVGYMVAGLANDTNIVTGPVFWILLGLLAREIARANKGEIAGGAKGEIPAKAEKVEKKTQKAGKSKS